MKTCSMCKIPKDEGLFSKKKASKDGLQSRCNGCMSKTMISVYYKDISAWNSKCRRQKGRKYTWVNELKSETKCVNCGEAESCCLEFHHKDPSTKEYEISKMISDCASDERILEEMKKCVVICANCHRKLHVGRISL